MMNHEAEKYLWDNMNKDGHGKQFSRGVINEMVNTGMIKSPKQAWRTLEKWAAKGWYEWGSTMDLGWKNA